MPERETGYARRWMFSVRRYHIANLKEWEDRTLDPLWSSELGALLMIHAIPRVATLRMRPARPSSI